MKAGLLVFLFWVLAQPSWAVDHAKAKKLPDAHIKKLLIEQAIQAYPGQCPCPYSTMRNGRACGGRSAWSRPGGHVPLCYEREVTKEMIDLWRRTMHNNQSNE